jgi:parallel beta-helix repeat protein
LFVGLVIIASFFIAIVPANVLAEEPEPPEEPEIPEEPEAPEEPEPPIEPMEPSDPGWTVSGIGTYFEITNSDYLNVTLGSTVTINVTLDSVPRVVDLTVRAVDGSTSTDISMTGFVPSMTYYRYQNGHLQESFVADADGNYYYTQDLTVPHHMYIQEVVSTKYIRDNPTGGDCTLIGTWDSSTKTCILTTNVYESIYIMNSWITLDGNGYTVSSSGHTWGIYVGGVSHITIKNVVIVGYSDTGIRLQSSHYSIMSGNTITNTFRGIWADSSDYSLVDGNTISPTDTGTWLRWSEYSTVSNNIITGHKYGVYLEWDEDITVSGNTISQTTDNGVKIRYSYRIEISGNTITNCGYSIYMASHSQITVSGNTISGGTSAVYLLTVSYATVINNMITQMTYINIYLYSSSGSTVSGNIITGGTYGIYLYSSSVSTVAGNLTSEHEYSGELLRHLLI